MWIGTHWFWRGEKCESWVQESYCKDQYLQAPQADNSGKFIGKCFCINGYDSKNVLILRKRAAVRLQVIVNVILALPFILFPFSICYLTSMKSFRKLNCWLLMKQLQFRCRWWSLCLAHIWSSCLLLLMGMTSVCFWWNLPHMLKQFF